MSEWIRVAIAVGAVLGATCGCAQPVDPPPDVLQSWEASPHIEGASALPLDPLLYPDEYTDRVMFDALEFAVRECMATHGLDYPVAEFQPGRPPDLYGLVGLERARQVGYRPPLSDRDSEGGEPLPEASVALLLGNPEDYVAARTSDGRVVAEYAPDSCSGTVTDRLQPGWTDLVDMQAALEVISDEALRVVNEDRPPREAWAEWSACMAGSGYEFDDPWAPYESLWAGSELRQDEIATAFADASCKASTNVLAEWSTELAGVQRELLHQNPGVLDRWLELRAEHLELAEEYLAGEQA